MSRVRKKIRRFVNQTHVSDYSSENFGWKKCKGNPVLGDSYTGSLFDPFVRIVNNEFIMCVSKRKNHSLVLYSSIDGIAWRNPKEILFGIQDSDWEEKVNRGCFIIRDGVWYLWYTGQKQGVSKIGLAKSEDGEHFQRIDNQPIMIPEHSYEKNAVMNPCVLWDEEKHKFRMWYSAGNSYEPDVICYAESPDGIKWEKYKGPVLQADPRIRYRKYKVGACDVLKMGSEKYYMAYISYQNLDVARIAVATSQNGITGWKDVHEGPILGPQKGKWDGHSIYKPTWISCREKNQYLLWYNGRLRTSERIGLACLEKTLGVPEN